MGFLKSLNYSSCNEDGMTELKALDVHPDDRIACITGSGDRVLHMLINSPRHVHAFDANPVQNHLLDLKMAAIRRLNYDQYTRFLGLHPASQSRLDTYRQVRADLSGAAAAWFDKNPGILRAGVLYAGRWERYFRLASRNMRLLRGRKIARLFEFNEVEHQRRFLHTEWNTPFWRLFLKISFNKPIFRLLFGDPGFYANLPGGFSPGHYIYDRMTQFLERHTARSSFMMALVFYGRFFDPCHYPPYLSQKYFDAMKSRLGCVTIHQAALFDLLDSPVGAECNKFSLSDVSSFLDRENYEKLFHYFGSRRNVRFCMRDFLTRRLPAAAGQDKIQYLDELAVELESDDKSFGYTFIIGQRK